MLYKAVFIKNTVDLIEINSIREGITEDELNNGIMSYTEFTDIVELGLWCKEGDQIIVSNGIVTAVIDEEISKELTLEEGEVNINLDFILNQVNWKDFLKDKNYIISNEYKKDDIVLYNGTIWRITEKNEDVAKIQQVHNSKVKINNFSLTHEILTKEEYLKYKANFIEYLKNTI